MLGLTAKQWYQILNGTISGLITGAAMLTPIFGQDLTPKIIAALGICNIIVSSIGVAVSGQAGLAKDVAAMEGVQVRVTPAADAALAKLAVDPSQPNIGALNPADREKLQVKAAA